ncbi:MAG TPA: RNA methyltransferase [Abditibacteriaceae bacterium]|jgi:TrmH family RNA methyltransferase
MITSRQHPVCKLVRKLADGKYRRQEKLFVVEGGNAVSAAIGARWPLQRLLAAPEDLDAGWNEVADAASIETLAVDPDILAYLADAQTSPGVIAIAQSPTPPRLEDIADEDALILVLDGVGDPGNVGTLIRTADAAGARAIVLTRGTADAFAPKVVRSSAGSVFHLPIFVEGAVQLDAELPTHGFSIVAAEAHDGKDCYAFNWPRRCALVLGHETRGVSERWLDAANERITIPLRGRAESLGVASAGAVLLFAVQQNAGK